MEAIKVYRRELGHLDVGCLDVANMLKGLFAVGDEPLAWANAHKERLVAVQLQPGLILLRLCQPGFADVDYVSLQQGVVSCQVVHMRLQPADVE